MRAPRRSSSRRDGTLTVGTDKPAYPPYFEDDDPANGKGFESAVAYAIADKLGFDRRGRVDGRAVQLLLSRPGRRTSTSTSTRSRSRRSARSGSTSPTRTTRRRRRWSRSRTRRRRTPRRWPTSTDAKLGVQIGTTSLDAATESIKPSSQPQVFNDSNDTVRALKPSSVDAIVVDLPTAFYLTAAEVPEAKIVGQFDAPGGDDWGVLLAKDSPLTTA